jgi:ABC-type Zn uptake system ZnuABC Zn-binding protein ZnuA
MRPTTLTTSLLAAGLVLAACGGGNEPGSDASPGAATAPAIATTTMLGSVLGDITACAGSTSETLMPPGADPHDFAPSSAQVAQLVGSDLVVANGLGLEESLADALESAEADGARVLEVAPLVDPIPFGEGGHSHDEGEEDDQEHGSEDPHFWQDVARMAEAAELIGSELADVTGDDAYTGCGTEVHDELMALDDEVRTILEVIPDERRILVTDHDALGYYADAYDFEVAGVVIPGGSTLAEPSSAELAELVEVIEDEQVPAIFANSANPTALVDAVAAETGTEVAVVDLFVDSLGPEGSGVETYQDMMRTNAQRIADALAG